MLPTAKPALNTDLGQNLRNLDWLIFSGKSPSKLRMGGAKFPAPLSAACIALILALLASTAHAQVFPASFEAAQINLASSATYYEDRAGDLTVEQATALYEQGLFRPNPREDIRSLLTYRTATQGSALAGSRSHRLFRFVSSYHRHSYAQHAGGRAGED